MRHEPDLASATVDPMEARDDDRQQAEDREAEAAAIEVDETNWEIGYGTPYYVGSQP